MCKRAVSRNTRDGRLSDLQMVQADIADSWIQLESFRLMVLRTAWLIDKHQDYQRVRKDIAAIKVMMPKVYNDIATKAAHLHGALGVSNEMPFMHMVTSSLVMGIADGPTEVHKVTVARQLLREYKATDDLWPTEHLPKKLAAAKAKYAEYLEHEVGNL
jgi:acyl-CoA dehydrogenase